MYPKFCVRVLKDLDTGILHFNKGEEVWFFLHSDAFKFHMENIQNVEPAFKAKALEEFIGTTGLLYKKDQIVKFFSKEYRDNFYNLYQNKVNSIA